MRGTRGLRLEMVTAIVQACGVHSEAAQAWADAWRRHCQADLKERRARQRAGYEQSLWWY